MAKIIPSIYDKENKPRSEKIVLELLGRALDGEWTIIHSFNYVYTTVQKNRSIGEIDFIICHPNHGILVLEVKGGQISYTDGVWYSGSNVIDPIKQTVKNWGKLLEILTPKQKSILTVPLAHAICFPDCNELKNTPAEADGITITKKDFPKIEEVITKIIDSRKAPLSLTKDKFQEIDFNEALNILIPKLEIVVHLDEQLETDKKVLDTLSDEQFNALCMLKNFDRFNVRGCAGSGKTILAINMARNIAKQGKKVLLLCYNKLLAKYISKALASEFNVTTRAFYEYCVEVAGIAKEELNKYKHNQKLYSVALPKIMREAIEKYEIWYDCIIVDEGQDFDKNAWSVITSMLIEDGKFYIFYDEDQNIFSNEQCIPQTPYPEIELTRNFRNSARVFEYIKKYIKKKNVSLASGAPLGQKVEEYVTSNKEESFKILKDVIKKLRESGVSTNSITILGAHSLQNTCIGENKIIGGYKVSESEVVEGGYMRYRTYMKFKGCESKVIIAIDVDDSDPRWNSDSALYTAFSRAKSLLIVIKVL